MTSRTRLAALLAAITATAATTALAAPAHAADLTLKDARGDVWRAVSATEAAPSPSTREGDLTRVVVSYAGRDVRVRLHFAALRKHDAYTQAAVRIQGKQGKVVRLVTVETSRRDRVGVHRIFNANGESVRATSCKATHHVDYAKDRVTVSLDRRCLSSPRAVRVNVNTGRATTVKKRDAVFYSDNAHDAAAESAAWSAWVKRG